MCDMPFFPIFPICFQCGTDQNPCHCKVVGPTLGHLLARLYLLWLQLHQDREGYAGIPRQTKRTSQQCHTLLTGRDY
ncbi:hypothetical protein NUU61_004901 [Penicillium alfredii]|uniref:Uncharacterized protein n=1 Tax=Penicillium alfredii TaxID=1506179 RepID=A0A9W9F8M0_9EURO|nr:uncharacterized protein NUU61_004901 [Penicillium alfredii]KAJ5095545.1 hypothetical protein NUU61_004901 [Penicillium alfredii]